MNKIVAVVPVWERFEILSDVVKYNSQHDMDFIWIVAREDRFYNDIMKLLTNAKGNHTVVEFPNYNLGRRMQHGIDYLLYEYERPWKYLMNLGSDNLISPKLFDVYQELMEDNVPFFGMQNLHVINSKTGECLFYAQNSSIKPIGAGRMIHRNILERVIPEDFIYPIELLSGLDGASQQKIKEITQIKPLVISDLRPLILDIKSDQNINPFEWMQKYSIPVDKSVIDSEFHPITLKYSNI